MKNHNQVEVILFTPYSFNNAQQKALVRWLGTTLQSAIAKQQERAKRISLDALKGSPPIYMS